MPGPFVIDASVFLNAFNPTETGSQVSKEMLARLQVQAVPLIAPTLLLPEVAAALSRLPNLVLVSLDQMLAQQALDIAALYRLRGNDAVYAAVAQRFACHLVALDHQQHDRLAVLLKTHYPEELLPTL